MIDFLNEHWWLAIILQSLLFLGDHYMTVVSAKLLKSYVGQHHVFQNGVELNPMFEKEVANFQWFTQKHLLALIGGIVALSTIRLLGLVAIFEFLIGAILLQWLEIDLLHIQNILYFRDIIRKPNSLTGTVESSYWLSQRQTAFRKISHAVFISVAALATMRLFFWGGVVVLIVQGFRHLKLANRNFAQTGSATLQKTNE